MVLKCTKFLKAQAMDTFTFVPTGNLDRAIPTGYCICNDCGARVETGIINLSEHYWTCPAVDRSLTLNGEVIMSSRAPHNCGADSVLISYDEINTEVLKKCGVPGKLILL